MTIIVVLEVYWIIGTLHAYDFCGTTDTITDIIYTGHGGRVKTCYVVASGFIAFVK